MNLDFLDSQTPGPETPLDLSQDKIYLMAAGIRQVYFLAWPYLQAQDSPWARVAIFSPCGMLEAICENRGVDVCPHDAHAWPPLIANTPPSIPVS